MAADEEERVVCADCVGEAYLKAEIIASGEERECSFCGHDSSVVSITDLAGWVSSAFEAHYTRTSDQPDAFQSAMLGDRESSYEWERDGEPVLEAIQGAASIEEDVAQEILDILADEHGDWDAHMAGEECEFDPESYYERRGPNDIEFQLEWRNLERSLKGETRFFNKVAESLLDRIFTGIEGFRTRDGRGVIRHAGPLTELEQFSRARVFHSDDKLGAALERPDRELGPPPSAVAVGGRMNARGVSLFYGATHEDSALSEVRPPVGSRVLVGKFDVIRPLRLLDIDALRSVYVEGSIFDPGYMGRLELAKFMESLSARMTMPVMPDDEPTEYLITQVIADYLAAKRDLNLDGLLYPSVQQRGDHQNVVLFRRASRVRNIDLPPGSEVSAMLGSFDEDGPSPDYWVSESVPPPEPPKPAPGGQFWPATYLDPFADPGDDREPALAVVMNTLQVHHVESIKFCTETFDVRRHRTEKRPSKLRGAQDF